jgi:long-chain acyl-CoA synthetase
MRRYAFRDLPDPLTIREDTMLATLISGGRTRRGEELEARVNRAAAGMRVMGLGRGQTVAILMRNDFPCIEVSLGAERAGITAVPMNWHGSVDELLYVLQDSGARAIFAHADLLERIRARLPEHCTAVVVAVPEEIAEKYRIPAEARTVPEGLTNYEQWLRQNPADVADPTPPAFRLLYTSGSTGKPKGVMRTRSNEELAERFARTARVAHGLEIRPIRAVLTGPLYHSAPGSYASNCVRYGELLVLQPRFDADELLDLIERHRISHVHLVPTMFSRLLGLPDERKARFDPSSLRAVAHGSAMCSPDLKRAMIDWWGPIIMEYYAATETGIITACTSEQWLTHPGSVGIPPDAVQLKIVGESGETLGPGEIGEIMAQGDIVSFASYRNQPEADRELKRDGWVTLGDMGYLDAEGFLWLCDRKKDLIISGGVNIFPAEVEQCIASHPAVRDGIVFGVPDADLGEAIGAVVELKQSGTATQAQLQEHVRAQLGGLRTPQRIHFTERLPREDNGKLSRRRMRAAFLEDTRPDESASRSR